MRRAGVPLLTLWFALALGGAVARSEGAMVVDLDARVNDGAHAVSVSLEAGTYIVESIGVADGGGFDAWSRWIPSKPPDQSFPCMKTTGCPLTVPTRAVGFLNGYDITSPHLSAASVGGVPLSPVNVAPDFAFQNFLLTGATGMRLRVDDGFAYPAALDALAGAQAVSFVLSAPGVVQFAVNDAGPIDDNQGGVSLRLTRLVPPVPPLDSFLCYWALRPWNPFARRGPVLAPRGSCTDENDDACASTLTLPGLDIRVSLADAFEAGTFTVQRPVRLCNPASVGGAPVRDAATHLAGYRISAAPAPAPALAAAAREGIKVSDQFHPEGQELVVDVLAADRLLVPTAIDRARPVDAPDAAAHDVDHLKCYGVQVSDGAPAVRPLTGVTFDDEFLEGPGPRTLLRPVRLCTPVDKNGEGLKSEANHLMCYKAVLPWGFPRLRLVFGVFTNGPLGPGRLDTLSESELCVPATVASP